MAFNPQVESPKAVSIVFGGFTIANVLGIPVVSFIAALYGWQASFVMCAAVNTLSLLGLLLWLPAFPTTEKTTYGKQLLILKKPDLWINFVLACLIVAAMYASYGYLAAYLRDITKMNGREISLMLMIFGITGIAGNWLAGKMLSRNIATTTIVFIALLSLSHIVVYYAGAYYIPMVIVIFLWGFIHTGGFLISNINVTTAASEAPEFVNSIFTTCGNLAVTIGSVVGGAVISHVGLHQVVWSSVALLVLSMPIWALSQYRSKT